LTQEFRQHVLCFTRPSPRPPRVPLRLRHGTRGSSRGSSPTALIPRMAVRVAGRSILGVQIPARSQVSEPSVEPDRDNAISQCLKVASGPHGILRHSRGRRRGTRLAWAHSPFQSFHSNLGGSRATISNNPGQRASRSRSFRVRAHSWLWDRLLRLPSAHRLRERFWHEREHIRDGQWHVRNGQRFVRRCERVGKLLGR
jgi:hypothetical protein